MLRRAKGYQLAALGRDIRPIQGYIGHKVIQFALLHT